MSNETNFFSRIFKFVSFQPIKNVKYCTIVEKKNGVPNFTRVFKYLCYTHEYCCDVGNGCCSVPRSTKYYESWCFWLFVFGIGLGCYLLCWYCNQLEKNRRAVRLNVDLEGNSPRMPSARLRPVEPNSVDHLLETLILSYRNRLATDQSQPMQNMDGTKIRSDSPPKYVDALNMPKPQIEPSDVGITTIAENYADIDDNTSRRTQNNDKNDNFVVVIFDDETVPSYEDATRDI